MPYGVEITGESIRAIIEYDMEIKYSYLIKESLDIY